MAEANEIEQPVDYEQEFLNRAQAILEDQGVEDDEDPVADDEKPKPAKKPKDEEPADGDDEDQDEPDDDVDEEPDEEDEGEDEDLPKISLRIDGKKVDPEEVLKHMTFTPVVDGEEVEVDYNELIKGYQRGADYSKKTTELKRMNDEIMPYNQMVAFAKHDPQFMSHVQSYFQNGAQGATDPILRTTDQELAALMDRSSDSYDPDKASEVLKARTEWQKTASERQQVTQKAQQEMMARYTNWAQEQINTAKNIVDSIGGEGEYEKKGESILAFLKETGFNDQEIGGQSAISATDARAAVLAYKASEYDRLMKEANAPRVRLGSKRKRNAPPRSQSSGTGTRRASGSNKSRDSYRKAVNTQRDDDWIKVIKSRMDL